MLFKVIIAVYIMIDTKDINNSWCVLLVLGAGGTYVYGEGLKD